MPFFGKKSTEKKSNNCSSNPPPYSEKPTNPDDVPYNHQSSAISAPGYSIQPPMYPGQMSQQPMYPGQKPNYPIQQPMIPGQQPPPGPMEPAVIHFDAGARFKPNQPIVIPPPPPGAAILPGQMAAYTGQPVIAVKNKSDFWNGGSSGGVVLY